MVDPDEAIAALPLFDRVILLAEQEDCDVGLCAVASVGEDIGLETDVVTDAWACLFREITLGGTADLARVVTDRINRELSEQQVAGLLWRHGQWIHERIRFLCYRLGIDAPIPCYCSRKTRLTGQPRDHQLGLPLEFA